MNEVSIFIGCTSCTYEQYYPTWRTYAVMRLLVPVLLSIGRLDLIRVLGAFVLYEIVYFFIWHGVVSLSYSSASGSLLFIVLQLLFSGGIIGSLYLYLVSQHRYFNPQGRGFPFGLCVLYAIAISGVWSLQQKTIWF